jgi:1-acyl-sn-glycerol-3-phosphate acyltransferase
VNQKLLEEPPFSFLTLTSVLKGTAFSVFLFSLLLVTNCVQMASLAILPFSRKGFRLINRFCANSWWGTCVVFAQKFYGTQIILTGDILPNLENAIIISNHQQMPDIFALMMLAKEKGRLGDLKWFVKDVLKYVPGIGWGMLFLDCLFVKRSWEMDKNMIHSIFSKFTDHNIPIWLISFVEGTRITPFKLKKSQNYAKANRLPIFKNVLFPRTKGFVASVQGLNHHVQAVYDITIGYPQGIPSLWQVAKGSAREFHLHVRRFPVDQLPQTSDGLSNWLVNCFAEKDELLQHFQSTGYF